MYHLLFHGANLSWHIFIPPASTKLKGGYTGITLSVCPSVDRIVSALYLQQYSSDPFHICTSYQATSEGLLRVMPVQKFNMIQYDSMVWVIMRWPGVSSERRRSSYILVIPPASTKLKGGYTGFALSVHLSCLLCIFNNTRQIHFVFAHLITQLQKVCCL